LREDSKQKSNVIDQSLPKSPVPDSTNDYDHNHQSKASESIFTPVPAPRKPKGIYIQELLFIKIEQSKKLTILNTSPIY
jgi:hypothetical protein